MTQISRCRLAAPIRRLLTAVVAASSLLVSACYLSDRPLLDADSSAQPFELGTYQWGARRISLRRDERGYLALVDGMTYRVHFQLYDDSATVQSWVVQATGAGGGAYGNYRYSYGLVIRDKRTGVTSLAAPTIFGDRRVNEQFRLAATEQGYLRFPGGLDHDFSFDDANQVGDVLTDGWNRWAATGSRQLELRKIG